MSDLVSFAFSSAEKKSMIDVLEKYRKNEVVDALIEILYMPGEIPLTVTDALILGGLVRPYYGFIADRILDHPAIMDGHAPTYDKARAEIERLQEKIEKVGINGYVWGLKVAHSLCQSRVKQWKKDYESGWHGPDETIGQRFLAERCLEATAIMDELQARIGANQQEKGGGAVV